MEHQERNWGKVMQDALDGWRMKPGKLIGASYSDPSVTQWRPYQHSADVRREGRSVKR